MCSLRYVESAQNSSLRSCCAAAIYAKLSLCTFPSPVFSLVFNDITALVDPLCVYSHVTLQMQFLLLVWLLVMQAA